jgi:hypothetical protein
MHHTLAIRFHIHGNRVPTANPARSAGVGKLGEKGGTGLALKGSASNLNLRQVP